MSSLGDYIPALVSFAVSAVVGLLVELFNVQAQRRSQRKSNATVDAKFSWESFLRNFLYCFFVTALMQVSASLDHLRGDYAQHLSKDPMVRAEESIAELGPHSLFPGVVADHLDRTKSLLADITQLQMALDSDEMVAASWASLVGRASNIVEVRSLQVRGATADVFSAEEVDLLRAATDGGAKVSVLVLVGNGSAATPPQNQLSGAASVDVRWIALDEVAKMEGYAACSSALGSLDFSLFDESVALFRSFSASGIAGGVATASREARVTPANRCYARWFHEAASAQPVP